MYRSSLRVLSLGLAACALLVPSSPAMASATTSGISTVSLGDSFASGEGGIETGPYLPGSDTTSDQCHRSQTSPARIAGLISRVNVVADASCSGATTENITNVSRYGEPPQATQLNSNVRLTYTMIGGNDIGFGTLVGCFLLTECTETPVPAASNQLLNVLGPKLDQAYGAILSRAPNARHVVVLYPPLLPRVMSAVTPNLSGCPQLSLPEVQVGNQLFTRLNAIIADRARAHGMKIVDPSVIFTGHDACSRHPWFYLPGTVPAAATYHPNLMGRVGLGVLMTLAA